MNIETAKSIPIREILAMLGSQPIRERTNDLFYLAPWRAEKTASLHISISQNLWFDHGEGIGGDTVALVSRHLKSHGDSDTVSDALRWLKNMTGYAPVIKTKHLPDHTKEDRVLRVKYVDPLKHPALIRYLDARGIPRSIGETYLKELRIYNSQTKKYFFALGLENEDGGYEIRNPFFKGCVKTKTVTFIRGTIPKPEGIHLFEGFMDYLSVITRRKGKPFEDDTIILNSLSCMKDASAYIKNYGYRFAYTWLDNDDAGAKAKEAFAEFFKAEEDLEHRPMEQVFAPYKDVNEWHIARPGLM